MTDQPRIDPLLLFLPRNIPLFHRNNYLFIVIVYILFVSCVSLTRRVAGWRKYHDLYVRLRNLSFPFRITFRVPSTINLRRPGNISHINFWKYFSTGCLDSHELFGTTLLILGPYPRTELDCLCTVRSVRSKMSTQDRISVADSDPQWASCRRRGSRD